MSNQTYVILDEQKGSILHTGGGTWAFTTAEHYYLDNTAWPAFAVNRSVPQGTMSITFEGTSIAIIGNTGGGDPELQRFTVAIDNNKPYNSTTYDTTPESLTYKQWYQSPTLPAGTHTLAFGDMSVVGVDYMAITPAPDTPLSGQTLLVDDTYSGITYHGSWQVSKGAKYDGGSILPGYTFQNTTTRTSTTGDSFSFKYSGSNLTVYALFDWTQVGGMKIAYTIDGGASFSNSFTAQGNSSLGWHSNANFVLLQTGPLASGIHTLNVTLTDCISQTLMIDYIVYQPDFPSLNAMPNLSGSQTTTTSSTTTSFQTGTPTGQSDNGGGGGDGGGGGSTNVGAIAGGVVGGLVFLGLIAAAFFFWWRRRQARNQQTYDYHRAPTNMAYANGAQASGATSSAAVSSPPQRLHSPDPSYIVEPFVGAPTPLSEMPPPSSEKRALPVSPGSSDYYRSSHMGSPPAPSVTGSTATSASFARRPDGMAGLSDSGSSSGAMTDNVDNLRRQIQVLAQENATLASMAIPPPAYHSQ